LWPMRGSRTKSRGGNYKAERTLFPDGQGEGRRGAQKWSGKKKPMR